ncbi:adenylosuccinate synthase [Brooklawnia sp.]|uniref:adenylosuccinate synthase n=1 Tax=Brooklawnia sp. TaxID=2699740 RepID=UPI00311FA026
MPGIIVLGAQWGDEGKGKAVDALGEQVDYVVRYSGGNNAGHTVVAHGEKFIMHLLPAGILNRNAVTVIGNGLVVDPQVMYHELDGLAERGVTVDHPLISANAHLITPYHQTLDKVTERFAGKKRIGTTGRGIGPAYSDKVNRVGLRAADLLDADLLHDKVVASLEQKNQTLVKIFNRREINAELITEQLLSYSERMRPYIVDSGRLLNDALDEGKVVLFEGAQAHHLDVDHGTYPFVTSSNPTAGGACTGTGVGPTRIDRVIGIAKAYTTRVGEGPFPTELLDADGEKLRQDGGEYGATTGRPRRCGWFDGPIVEVAAKINGCTDIFLTKLDVLSGWEKIPVCVAYDIDGVRSDVYPMTQPELCAAKPIYEYLPGWSEDISAARRFDELPANCQAYVHYLENLVHCRISGIGVGPGREESIIINPLI